MSEIAMEYYIHLAQNEGLDFCLVYIGAFGVYRCATL